MRKINKHATREDIKALLCAFYDFKIATGVATKSEDKGFLDSFDAEDEDSSIKECCAVIENSSCSEALKDSARCIKKMFESKE